MQPVHYAITSGMAGCYMPDAHWGTHEIRTRAEMADLIRDHLRMADMPASLFREARLAKRLWPFLKHHGSSTAHFRLVHQGRELAFHGLTLTEFREQQADE